MVETEIVVAEIGEDAGRFRPIRPGETLRSFYESQAEEGGYWTLDAADRPIPFDELLPGHGLAAEGFIPGVEVLEAVQRPDGLATWAILRIPAGEADIGSNREQIGGDVCRDDEL